MNKLIIFLFAAVIFAGCVQEETPMPQPPITPPIEPPEQPECQVDSDCSGGFECINETCMLKIVSREAAIPEDAVKITPETDKIPPELHSDEFEEPVPMSGPINTAGGEDSPFMMPDGKTFYVFFTPDVRVPVNEQLFDGSTAIYVSHKVSGEWSEPERIVLNDDISLDGCAFIQGNKMWFCSARGGYTGVHWFTAEYEDGKWQNWQNADEELKTDEYETGELHISADGTELYFHSYRPGGKGELDVWVSKKVNGEWGEPVNIEAVNTERNDGWPALNPAEDELWITRDYGIWRSKKVDGEWTEAELIVSALAGEATFDNEGNVYFTHHFYDNDTMLEADIYVIKRK